MEDEIKELLGENYQEGMTAKDVQEAFNKMLLSSGKYVNKDNAEAQQRKIKESYKKQIDELNQTLNTKLTDDEKLKAAQKQKDEEFETLKKLLEQSQLDASLLNFKNNIADVRNFAGIDEEDSEFLDFVSNATLKDKEKNDSVSKYINSIVKKAYEKGKSDAVKEELGKMGKDGKSSQGDDDGSSEVDQKVKAITNNMAKQAKSYYFK